MKKLILFLLLCSLANAALYDLNTLKKKDNSLAKDYYIHRLLEQNKISKQEAQSLRKHIFRYAGKIKKALDILAPRKAYIDPKYAKCYNYNSKSIVDANLTCQIFRLNSLQFISNMDANTRTKLANKLKNSNGNLSILVSSFNHTNPLNFIIENFNTTHFFKLWSYFKNPDLHLSGAYLDKLALERAFKDFSRNIIIKNTHPNIRKSFLEISPQSPKAESAFYMGVNALIFNKEQKAQAFFENAYKTYEKRYDKDNALFWVYQIGKKETDLNTLATSPSLNIYSIWAKEMKGIKDLPKFTLLEAKNKNNANFDMKDPFLWQSLSKEISKADKNKLEKMSKEFNAQNTLPIYAYILERVYNFNNNYFIMPYYEYIKDYDKKRQALILAIGRQESRFIPTAVSTSYALGMMQFMPFVANHIAKKELKLEKFDQDDMFEPKTAYFFANHHLNYLEKELKSPVLISYAYNGGIGFTKKMLERGLFKAGKYEPFLSMELVTFTESRIYAKRVLANYIVYLHLLNDNTKISSIFESLIQRN